MSTEENDCTEQVKEETADVKPAVEHSVKVGLSSFIRSNMNFDN